MIASRESAADGRRSDRLLTHSKATVMQATPATWRMLLAAGWDAKEPLKILCGGEALSRELAGQLRRRGRAIWNLYGPTETTVWSTVCDVTVDTSVARRTAGDSAADPAPPRQEAVESIGQPIVNTQVYVLDQWLQPQPIGVPGELYIGGDGLARGYFGRPDLTAERFIPHPFCDDPHARIYRTGDLARLQPDGNLASSTDRPTGQDPRLPIELEEIETVLNRHRSVDQAVVVAEWKRPAIGAWSLGHMPVPATRSWCRSCELARDSPRLHGPLAVPEDRSPAVDAQRQGGPPSPAGLIERGRAGGGYVARARSWKGRSLSLARCWNWNAGVHDNFSSCGHSLKAALLAARMQQEQNMQLSLLDVFRHPTIAGLAESITTPGFTKWRSVRWQRSRRVRATTSFRCLPKNWRC